MISPRFDLWAYRQVGGRRGALLAGIAKTTRRMSRLASLNVQRAKPQILAGMLGPLTSYQLDLIERMQPFYGASHGRATVYA